MSAEGIRRTEECIRGRRTFEFACAVTETCAGVPKVGMLALSAMKPVTHYHWYETAPCRS